MVLVSGTEAQAEALKVEVAAVLSTVGLRLSEEKTSVCNISEGFDFLGFRIQRKRKRGTNRVYVYSWPSKKALASIMAKVKAITKQGTSKSLPDLLHQLNRVLRGWTTYFQYGVSKATFRYLIHYTWLRVNGWLRRKFRRSTWKERRRRYLGNGWRPQQDGVILFDSGAVLVSRYRYRGTKIPSPWDGWIRAMAEG